MRVCIVLFSAHVHYTQTSSTDLAASRMELADTRGALERLRQRAAASSNGAQRHSAESDALHADYEALERYCEGLKEENERMKGAVMVELSQMKADTEVAAQVQQEGLVRLQMDRDELAKRLEMSMVMLDSVPRQQQQLPLQLGAGPTTDELAPPVCARRCPFFHSSHSQGAKQRRLAALKGLDAKWHDGEKQWLTTLEKMVEEWRQLMISDVYLSMPQHERDAVVAELHDSCLALGADLHRQRQFSDAAFLDGVAACHRASAQDASARAASAAAGRFSALAEEQVRALQRAEAASDERVAAAVWAWSEQRGSPAFLALPAAHQAAAERQHHAVVAQEKQAAHDERAQLEEAHARAVAALEAEAAAGAARRAADARAWDDAVARQSGEAAGLQHEWGKQLESFVREIDLLISDHATHDELGEFNGQVYGAWALAAAQRTQLIERHCAELEVFDEEEPVEGPSSSGAAGDSAAGQAAVEKLAFLLNTRPRIAAFVSDAFRVVQDGKKVVHQIAELFPLLPTSKTLAPSVLAPLQRAIGSRYACVRV